MFGALSDHFACFTSVKLFDNIRKQKPKWTTVYKHSQSDVDNFCSELQLMIQRTQFNQNLDHDPNENYTKLESIVSDAKQKCMPSKLEKVNRYKHKLNPWMTSEILKSIKVRDQMYKKMKASPPDSQEYESKRINLNTCNSLLQKSIRNAKALFYGREFEKHKNDSRKTWSTIKNLINRNRSTKEFPSYFLINNSKETDQKIIANKFNEFFTNIGPSLAKKIKVDTTCTYKKFLRESINSSFQFNLVTIKLIEKK